MRTIGKLAAATGVKVPTIRFYEEIGLLPQAERSASDRRLYGDAADKRLRFIVHARQLGFSIEAIRTLLDLSDHPDRPCDEANRLAGEQLEAVKQKVSSLLALQTELQRLVDTGCRGKSSDCRVIEVLGDHGACLHHRIN